MRTVNLTDTFRHYLTAALTRCRINPYEDPIAAMKAAASIIMQHPDHVQFMPALDVADSGKSPVVRFRNCPVDADLSPTPMQVLSPPPGKTTFVTELFLMGMARVLGLTPFGYSDEKEGACIHQVCPVPGKEETISSNGSGDFGLHTEGPHLDNPPEFFFLSCLRGHEAAKSPLVAMHDICAQLHIDTLAVLQRPEFEIVSGASYANPMRKVLPIIYNHHPSGRPVMRFHAHNVRALTPAAEEALAQFKSAAWRAQNFSVLYPGDLLFFENIRVLHGRTGFPVNYDGNQRWLQRCYLTSDFGAGPVLDAKRLIWRGGV